MSSSVVERCRGASDDDILALAVSESRIVITSDHDFGELVYRHGRLAAGVVLLRLRTRGPEELLARLEEHWPVVCRHAEGRFVVVSDHAMRVRPLGGGSDAS